MVPTLYDGFARLSPMLWLLPPKIGKRIIIFFPVSCSARAMEDPRAELWMLPPLRSLEQLFPRCSESEHGILRLCPV
jgi:hypothetical protein